MRKGERESGTSEGLKVSLDGLADQKEEGEKKKKRDDEERGRRRRRLGEEG